MFDFLCVKSFDSLHPFVIHLPVALLLVVPLFIIWGIFDKNRELTLYYVSAVLMTIGMLGTILAVMTGESAAELITNLSDIQKNMMEEHKETAENARNIFIALSLIYVIFISLPRVTKKPNSRKTNLIFNIIYLLIYTAGLLVLFYSSHTGGILVHKLGLKALL